MKDGQQRINMVIYPMPTSYIQSLHVKNFRQFDELHVEFGSGFNFIAGPNGCGKTSVLAGVAHSVTHYSLEYSQTSQDSEVFIDVSHKGQLLRVGLGAGTFENHGYRTSRAKAWGALPEVEGRKTVLAINVTKEIADFAPLLLGARRSLRYVQTQGMAREPLITDRRSAYRNNSVSHVFEEASTNVKQWLINRYFMIDKDWAVIERHNWNRLLDALPAIAPFDSNFSFVSIGADLEPVFSIYGRECHLEELSSGFQAVLTIVARIIEWVEGIEENELARIENAIGSVLIDEIDIHLHPEWQFTLRDGLSALFPQIQFIVTTHSPHVLASAQRKEVIVMPANIRGRRDLSPADHSYSGWTTDQILTEVMGVRSLDNKLYETSVHRAFDNIERKDEEGLKNSIALLKSIAHPDDAVVKVLEVKLASLLLPTND